MTPTDLRAARRSLGLSAQTLATLLRIADGATIRKYERGAAAIPGPVQVIIEALLSSRAVRRHFGLSIEAVSTSKSE